MNSVSPKYSIAITAIRTTFIFLLIFSFVSSPVESKLLASAASTHSVTLNWTAPGDDGNQGQAAQYDIRYATFLINDGNWDQANQAANIPAPQMAGSAESITIDGLSSSTTYYFAIRVADEVPNWSPTSNVVSVSTAAESDAPSDVTDLLTSNPSNTSLDLTWTSPGDDSTAGTATQYDIRYSTVFINDSNFDQATAVSGEPSPSPAGSSESMTVTGLDPTSDYYFAIKTADEVPNWSGISNTASGTTINEQIAPSDIANLLATSSTDTSITITWTAPGDDGNSGTASQYDIRYSTSNINGANFYLGTVVSGAPSPASAGSSESMIVTGLNPATTYYFAIKTADEIPNWSGLSNVTNLATLVEQQAPANIADLASSNTTDSSITITWTAPGDDGAVGTATLYDIRYSSTAINIQNWDSAIQISDEPSPLLAGTTQSYTLAGLPQGVGYFFAIKTADEIPNWSGLSNILAVATAGDNTPPAAINDLGAQTGSTEGTIDLSWTAPGDDGLFGEVQGYVIRLDLDSLNEGNWSDAFVYTNPPNPVASGNIQSTTLSGLIPGETYHIGIKSVDNALNFSDISNSVSAEAMINLATDVDEEFAFDIPEDFELQQNYPNPFNPSTTIEYSVREAGHVELSVYDLSGRKTATLVNEGKSAGLYAATWGGDDGFGNPVASGVYFYRIESGDYVESKKMVLVK